MRERDPFPTQLWLRIPSDSPVSLEGAARNEIIQLLAQLLGSAVGGASVVSLPEESDEAH
jgi:hypothetical protein